MKRIRKMTFHLPIEKESLKAANRSIARSARKGEKVTVEWKNNSA